MPFLKLLKKLYIPLSTQKGALFGMDARIALIVTSILIGTGAITIMSRIERSKVLMAETTAEELRQAVLTYYKTISITELPETLDELFEEGLIDDVGKKRDPWGKTWYYTTYSQEITLEGTELTLNFATIHSGGKDGSNNSETIQTDIDYATWAPLNDDVGLKLNTREVEQHRVEEHRARAQLITDKLSAFETSQYLEATGTCESTKPEAYCESFEGKNYTQMNYYPQSDLDQVEDVVYFSAIKGLPAYTAGDVNDMETLLAEIGLPTSYAQDPWGRILFYHSNVTERSNPLFTASICFSDGGSCF